MSMKWLTDDSQTSDRSSHAKSWRRRMINAVICATLVAGLAGCSLLPDEMQEEEIPTIKPPKLAEKPTYPVKTDTIETKVRGSGKIMSMKEEGLFFTLEGGSYRVKNVYVEVGDAVAAGDIIAELDVQTLIDGLRLEEINFRETELNMKKTLRNTEGLSEEDLELKKIQFEKARLALTEKREQIARAQITAPFGGTVVSVSTKPGDTAQAYTPVVVLADMSQLTVAVQLSQDQAKNIAVGMEASVDINAAGSHKGKVARLPVPNTDGNNNGGGHGWDPWGNPLPGNQPKQDSVDNYLLIKLDAFPKEVTRATPLSAAIVTERKENVVVIPPSALRTYGGRTYVQVVEKDGTKREADVEVGQQTSTQVEIVKGLEPGMKVVGR